MFYLWYSIDDPNQGNRKHGHWACQQLNQAVQNFPGKAAPGSYNIYQYCICNKFNVSAYHCGLWLLIKKISITWEYYNLGKGPEKSVRKLSWKIRKNDY